MFPFCYHVYIPPVMNVMPAPAVNDAVRLAKKTGNDEPQDPENKTKTHCDAERQKEKNHHQKEKSRHHEAPQLNARQKTNRGPPFPPGLRPHQFHPLNQKHAHRSNNTRQQRPLLLLLHPGSPVLEARGNSRLLSTRWRRLYRDVIDKSRRCDSDDIAIGGLSESGDDRARGTSRVGRVGRRRRSRRLLIRQDGRGRQSRFYDDY